MTVYRVEVTESHRFDVYVEAETVAEARALGESGFGELKKNPFQRNAAQTGYWVDATGVVPDPDVRPYFLFKRTSE